MATLPTILVTGGDGQLGSELRALAPHYPHYHFVFLTRHDAPLTDKKKLKAVVRSQQPAYVINCAAYTAVDKAESERDEAFQVNAAAVEVLATACAAIGARFLHLSTDYVFDGQDKTPRLEDDPVAPLNVYGQTKLAGEQAALAANPASVIIRTSWVYSAYGKNFVKTMLRLMGEKESINVVNDQWGSPTYAADLAKALLEIIAGGRWTPGIYHFSNEGVITWFEFASEIAREIGTRCAVTPTTTAMFPTPARRPLYSVMRKEKIQQVYGLTLQPWKESLRTCLQRLRAMTTE